MLRPEVRWMRLYLVESRSQVKGKRRWTRWVPYPEFYWNRRDARETLRAKHGDRVRSEFRNWEHRVTAWEKVV